MRTGIAGLILALALSGAARAETAVVNIEELNLYPERYAGKTITVEGVLFMADKDSALLEIKSGKLKDFSMVLGWAGKGAVWEKAQYECAESQRKPTCQAKVTGFLKQNEYFKDEYSLENAKVEFLGP